MKAKELGSTPLESTSKESTEYRLEFAPRALGDIDAAIAWLADTSKSWDVATSWAETVIQKIQTLTFSPERCPLAPESESWDEPVRHLLVGDGGSQFRIVFTVRPEVVRVLAVKRSRRAT